MPTPPPEAEAAGAAADLDEQVRRADPDRWLATRFIADWSARADVLALYAYDAELSRAVRVASNALMAEIRLTWWREVLDQVFAGEPVRRHPVAQAIAGAISRHDLPRDPLEAMIDARFESLEAAALDAPAALDWADRVGGSAAVLAARILDRESEPERVALAGRVWGLVLLRRAGRFDADRPLADALAAVARPFPTRVFPAVAQACLGRAELKGAAPSELGKRLRLLWAAARGTL